MKIWHQTDIEGKIINWFYRPDEGEEKRPLGHARLYGPYDDCYAHMEIGERIRFSGTTFLERKA